MGEKVQVLDMTAVRQIESWDKFSGKRNDAYDDILKYLETTSLHSYLQDFLLRVNNDQMIDSDKFYGVDKRFAYVLTDDGKVLAFTFFYLQDALLGEYDMYIQSVAVNPEERGKGYGQKLLSQIIVNNEKFIGEKVRKISAAIDFRNLSSQKLFGRLGLRKSVQIRSYCFMGSTMEQVKENILFEADEEGCL